MASGRVFWHNKKIKIKHTDIIATSSSRILIFLDRKEEFFNIIFESKAHLKSLFMQICLDLGGNTGLWEWISIFKRISLRSLFSKVAIYKMVPWSGPLEDDPTWCCFVVCLFVFKIMCVLIRSIQHGFFWLQQWKKSTENGLSRSVLRIHLKTDHDNPAGIII